MTEDDTFKALCLATPEEIIEIYEKWTQDHTSVGDLYNTILKRGWSEDDAYRIIKARYR
jgi:hypothetical protein